MIPGRFKSAVKVLLRGERRLPPEPPREVQDNGIPYGTSWFQEAGRQIHTRGIFIGCPLGVFEYTSKDPFCLALMEGLNPNSAVLEVGCGCLRVGSWFIRYLLPGNYCGIEPNARMVEAGRELILSQMGADRRPRFSSNDTFDFGVFGTTFDFVLAFSIWSHASKCQISTMLDQFKKTANSGAKFITSWHPAREGLPDYQGTSWIGRSHQSDQPGTVAHDRGWIKEAASSRGLGLRFFDGFTTIGQYWLIFSRP